MSTHGNSSGLGRLFLSAFLLLLVFSCPGTPPASADLATMSHELRTPLNSIIGFTGIMLQGLAGPLSPEQQKQMTMVQNSSRHLLALINDVLDISKIEAGQLDLSVASFDPRPSIEKMVKLVSWMIRRRTGICWKRFSRETGMMFSRSQTAPKPSSG